MIDNLIYDPMKQIWSCILKVMNFLIFRDFFKIFMNFSEFLMIFFGIFLNFYKFKIDSYNLKSIL